MQYLWKNKNTIMTIYEIDKELGLKLIDNKYYQGRADYLTIGI